MRDIRLYGSEGGGAARSPYPYRIMLVRPTGLVHTSRGFGAIFLAARNGWSVLE